MSLAYIQANSGNGIFNKFEGLVVVLEGVPIGTISSWFEAILTEFMCLNLFPQLSLNFQESLHELRFLDTFGWLSGSKVQNQEEFTKFDFRGQCFSTIEHIEKYFWNWVTRSQISISQVTVKALVGRGGRNCLRVRIQYGLRTCSDYGIIYLHRWVLLCSLFLEAK